MCIRDSYSTISAFFKSAYLEYAAAYKVIVPVREATFYNGLVVGCYPAEAYSCKREYLGHAADGYALVVQIDDGFAPSITRW
mgnify:FL=1